MKRSRSWVWYVVGWMLFGLGALWLWSPEHDFPLWGVPSRAMEGLLALLLAELAWDGSTRLREAAKASR